jgi:hypothetical protein
VVEDASTVADSFVLGDEAVCDRQGTPVPDPAAITRGDVTADGAAVDRDGAKVTENARAESITRGAVTADGAAVDRDGAKVPENARADSVCRLTRVLAEESIVADVAPSADLDWTAEYRTDPGADLDRAIGRKCVVGLLDHRSALRAGVDEQLEGRLQHRISAASGNEGPLKGGIQANADQAMCRKGVLVVCQGVVGNLALARDANAERLREVDDAAAEPRARVAVDLAAITNHDSPLKVGGDAATRAVGRVAVNLTSVGDGHTAEQDDDPGAKHPNRLVIVHLAGGDDHIAGHLADPAATEVPRAGRASIRRSCC